MSELIRNPQDMYPHMTFMRWDIINTLIEANNYKSYLEIGVYDPKLNFDKIKCKDKVGVDPDSKAGATFVMSSDIYFKATSLQKDIIFIDGLHQADQVYRDIKNALNTLAQNGTIVCHDMNPTSQLMASQERKTRLWCGDCYQAWIRLRRERTDLSMYVVDTDFGVGVIQKGEQAALELKEPITWNSFVKNKKHWLNLISVDEFKSFYPVNANAR